ncbi:MAG: YggT family protein [Vampirovibrionales bacterium]|nr:YggT family protein [Vampirovibrionales bacterium]
MSQLGYTLSLFLDLLKYLIIFRCILSFFPRLNWDHQPWLAIRSATDPIMMPFRNLIPPLGGMDFSPFLLFFLIDLIQKLVLSRL